MHIPYHHQDAFEFLRAIKKLYKPTRVINIGDEADKHGISFHDSDPDLMSAGDELIATQHYCQELQKIFPYMDLVESNHGSLSYRRAKAGGIPRHYLKDYAEVLKVKNTWKWYPEIHVKCTQVQDILFRHQFQANIIKSAEQNGMSCVQGHYHSKFEIGYTSSPRALNWGMTVGCLVDSKSLAMAYNKLQPKRPILGVGVITNGFPQLISMYLDKRGGWNGEVSL
jgi:hypothetical protein